MDDAEKREYHPPALEDLGTVAELTADGPGASSSTDNNSYRS
jgi:hypothetical protein